MWPTEWGGSSSLLWVHAQVPRGVRMVSISTIVDSGGIFCLFPAACLHILYWQEAAHENVNIKKEQALKVKNMQTIKKEYFN